MANGKKDPPKSIGKAIVNTLLDPFEVSKSIDKINPVENIYEMIKKMLVRANAELERVQWG